jgi:lysozyme
MGIRQRLTLIAGLALAAAGLANCASPKTQVPAPQATVTEPASVPAPAPRHINAEGLALIKESEGLHLRAYRDNGQWLIGYGHAAGAERGAEISADRAEALLVQDLAACETNVAGALTRPATANQFSAMVSLCYNVGTQRIAGSSLVKRFNAGDVQGAADAFLDWTKANVGGTKAVLPRLADRRKKERALFLRA